MSFKGILGLDNGAVPGVLAGVRNCRIVGRGNGCGTAIGRCSRSLWCNQQERNLVEAACMLHTYPIP